MHVYQFVVAHTYREQSVHKGSTFKNHPHHVLKRYGTHRKYETWGASKLIHILVDFHNGSIAQNESCNAQANTLWNSPKYESMGAWRRIHVSVDFQNGSTTDQTIF